MAILVGCILWAAQKNVVQDSETPEHTAFKSLYLLLSSTLNFRFGRMLQFLRKKVWNSRLIEMATHTGGNENLKDNSESAEGELRRQKG